MLDKQNEPSFNDLIHYCGESGSLWLEFDKYLENEYSAQKQVRFPYGKHYGWSVKYSVMFLQKITPLQFLQKLATIISEQLMKIYRITLKKYMNISTHVVMGDGLILEFYHGIIL